MRRDCRRIMEAMVLIIPRPNIMKRASFSREGRGMRRMSLRGSPSIQRSIKMWNADVADEGELTTSLDLVGRAYRDRRH